MTPAEHIAEAERLLAVKSARGYGAVQQAADRKATAHALVALAMTTLSPPGTLPPPVLSSQVIFP